MGDFFFRNVRADECSAPGTRPGAMMVRYKGEEYAVIGVYFMGARSSRHVLCYVLRELLGSEEAVSALRGRPTPSITERPEHGAPGDPGLG